MKSIIDVEVNEGAFKAFYDKFQQYQSALAKQPAAWANIGKNITGIKSGFEAVIAAMAVQAEIVTRAVTAHSKSAKFVESQAHSWRDIARFSKETASNVSRTALTLLKWGGLASGLLGAGGLLGIDRLADAIASKRRAAAGLGVGYGQQQAFGLNYGRFVDPGSMLSSIAAAMSDPAHPAYRGILYSLGGRQPTGSPADVAVQVMKALPRLFPGGAKDPTLGTKADAFGLTTMMSVEDIKRYLGASPQERDAQAKHYTEDSRRLDTSSSTQRAWNDLETQLGRAGRGIERTFVDGLKPLVPGIEKLSASFEHTVETLLKEDGPISKWISQAGPALEKFGTYIGSGEFQQNVVELGEAIGKAGRALAWLASWVPSGAASDKPSPLFDPKVTTNSSVYKWMGGGGLESQQNLLNTIRKLERSGDSAVSPAGAVGRYQIMPDTAKQYGFDPSRLTDPAYNKIVAQRVLSDLAQRYHGNTDEVLSAYNAGPGRANRYRDSGHNPSSLPAETRAYLDRAHALPNYSSKVTVEILNNTGGNAIVNSSQLPQ